MKKIFSLLTCTLFATTAFGEDLNCGRYIVRRDGANVSVYSGNPRRFQPGNLLWTVDGKELFFARYSSDLVSTSDDGKSVQVKYKFGKRFALTGYYGSFDLRINLETRTGHAVYDQKSHLVGDINAPQGDRHVEEDLTCAEIDPNSLEIYQPTP